MSKAKWVHKQNPRSMVRWDEIVTVCKRKSNTTVSAWTKVTCPKCLAKKPKLKKKKELETNIFLELDGKVFLTEKTKTGKIISKEEFDGILVLKCFMNLIEKGLKNDLFWLEYNKQNKEFEENLEAEYDRQRKIY